MRKNFTEASEIVGCYDNDKNLIILHRITLESLFMYASSLINELINASRELEYNDISFTDYQNAIIGKLCTKILRKE